MLNENAYTLGLAPRAAALQRRLAEAEDALWEASLSAVSGEQPDMLLPPTLLQHFLQEDFGNHRFEFVLVEVVG